jgi:RNA polymerase sigma-B factor
LETIGEDALAEEFEIEGVVEEICDFVERPAAPATSEARVADSEFNALFAQWRKSGDAQLRERLILMHRNLVSFLARRFADRGEGVDDIVQQGMIGLIYALDHFDPARGVRFATFATPTIIGEIRRYFRDKTRGVRIPRRVQELHQMVVTRLEALTQQLDRSPTYWELAQSLNLPIEDVIEALETGRAMETVSLDEPMGDEESTATSLIDQLGDIDPDIARWDERSLLQAALQKLPEKHRMALRYAYFDNYSQVEIAGLMKVSQMHVSRLLRAALAELRQHLEAER